MCKRRKSGNWSRANKTKTNKKTQTEKKKKKKKQTEKHNKDGLDNETKAADRPLHQKGQTHWMREKREMPVQERKTDDCTREKDRWLDSVYRQERHGVWRPLPPPASPPPKKKHSHKNKQTTEPVKASERRWRWLARERELRETGQDRRQGRTSEGTYLCKDRFSPGTHPRPPSRRQHAPSLYCAGFELGATSASLQTAAKHRQTVHETSIFQLHGCLATTIMFWFTVRGDSRCDKR